MFLADNEVEIVSSNNIHPFDRGLEKKTRRIEKSKFIRISKLISENSLF